MERSYLVGVVSAGPRERAFVVGAGDAGSRLDAFLARALGCSRAEVRVLFEEGRVTLGAGAVPLRARGRSLSGGERVAVVGFTPVAERRIASDPEAALRVLAEGPGWLALDKPAGVPVHPLREGERGTLLGAALARHPELQGVGEGGLRSGLVHRLDTDTSGVVLVATGQAAWQRLREGFRTHRARKLYRALVLGTPEAEGREELALRVSRHRPARVTVAEPGDPEARITRLAWRRLEILGPAALVEVSLETGFLHQIRASFAHRGHPVAGDRRYGAADDPTGALRQMLHAARLELDEIQVASPDPEDFAAILERLRSGSW
jgi:23S rRNA pseudouridine1911/1915/1917 synthase